MFIRRTYSYILIEKSAVELEGKIWKNKNHWLVSVPSLDVMTQGETREEALMIVADLVEEYIKYYFPEESNGLDVIVKEHGKTIIGLQRNSKLLMAFSLIK